MAQIIKVDLKQSGFPNESIETIKGVLCRGGVIAFPTDTFYGLGANPFNELAVAHIFKIKNRSPQKPILVLIASMRQLDQLASEVTPEAEKLMQNLWPGPLTLLFKALPHLPKKLIAGTGKIGVRMPAHEFSQRLVESIGHPITATSANISGQPNARTADDIANCQAEVDLIVDGGITSGGKESTILDTTISPPKLLREGAISKAQIEAVLNMEITVATGV